MVLEEMLYEVEGVRWENVFLNIILVRKKKYARNSILNAFFLFKRFGFKVVKYYLNILFDIFKLKFRFV
ncbi:hypothetical protein HDC90_000272 [Pedobacter sp. AK013]|nr:hypothetical protein [Pedobacter sp. AK013]